MSETILGAAVEFLEEFGFFDVILPFLLVFTVVFGILEKTRVFGTYDGAPKKNINSMVAFVIAFFVVAAKEIVDAMKESLPIVALLLIAIVSFLMLVGSFASGKEEFDFLKSFESWKLPLAGVFGLSIFLIFLHSFGWLTPITDYLFGDGVVIFILVAVILVIGGIIAFVVGGRDLAEE
ncbi:hypothetical protein HOD38_00795 [archaeon]|nr:hypothetical protein [archaeon]MBT4396783.1 hypothetical protein [archaeon]MBT4440904.1 hypothetical protein [archaeon]